jgi:hypothetical protein
MSSSRGFSGNGTGIRSKRQQHQSHRDFSGDHKVAKKDLSIDFKS